MNRAIALALTLLGVGACSPPCYGPDQCFAADQAQRDRGVAMMAIGASLMSQPRPIYVVRPYW